jgi:hypothetical protein
MGLTNRSRLIVAAAALLALAAAPAPSPQAAAARDASNPAALRRWYEHGKCLVERQGPLAERILATAPDSRDFLLAFLAAEAKAQCFAGESTTAPKLHRNATRGAIVEALLLRDFSAVGVLRASRAAPVFDLAAPVASAWPGADPRARSFLKLAECIVRLEPAKSFALFSTPVSGPPEAAAVGALAPAIADCLPPDLELILHPPMLRSYLAEAAYRVSAAETAPAGR